MCLGLGGRSARSHVQPEHLSTRAPRVAAVGWGDGGDAGPRGRPPHGPGRENSHNLNLARGLRV